MRACASTRSNRTQLWYEKKNHNKSEERDCGEAQCAGGPTATGRVERSGRSGRAGRVREWSGQGRGSAPERGTCDARHARGPKQHRIRIRFFLWFFLS